MATLSRILTLVLASVLIRVETILSDEDPTNLDDQDNDYITLCEGGFQLPNNVTNKLKCYYKSGPHHFLRYARVKTEQLLLRPKVVMFHEIISDHEMEHIKDVATPNLKRAIIQGFENGKLRQKLSESRTNNLTWVSSDYSSIVLKFAQRISDVTGLDVGDFPIQVNRYDIGEYYLPHYDYFTGEISQVSRNGNRVASIVTYMSEVSEGGATVFIYPRLTVFPVKGSAVFWMNLLPSGEGDPDTLHSGCPVTKGVKWAAVIWKYENNDKRKQCSIQDSDDTKN